MLSNRTAEKAIIAKIEKWWVSSNMATATYEGETANDQDTAAWKERKRLEEHRHRNEKCKDCDEKMINS